MKKILLILVLISIAQGAFSQVGINTTSPNAQLDIKSSNQLTPSNTDGILIPKIDAFPVTNPTAAQQGMMVYLTTVSAGKQPGFYYWDNNGTPQWRGFTGNAGWELTGNSGTIAGTNFIGTIDDNDVVFKRNNVISGRIATYSTSFGNEALFSNTTGDYNTAIGSQTLYNNTDGHHNMAFGNSALGSNTNGAHNVAFGFSALNQNDNGLYNVAMGSIALSENISGISNTAIGAEALREVTGSNNTALGFDAGVNTTTGNNNIAIGANTNVPNVAGNDQMSIGNVIYGANMSTTALGKIGIGVPVPAVKLDVAETINTATTVINATHSNPPASTKIIKTTVNSGVLASGVITSNENSIVLTNSVQGIGVLNAISGTTNDAVYGFRNLISNIGSSTKYGLNNSFTGTGTGSVYGVSNRFATATSTQQNGVFNTFTGTPAGLGAGLHNIIEDNGNGDKMGVLDSITNTGNGRHFGIKNVFKGDGSGQRYGSYSKFEGTGNGHVWGSFNEIHRDGNGNIIGNENAIYSNGSGQHYGAQNYISGSGTGVQVGTENYIGVYNSTMDPQRGTANFITGDTSGIQTGTYNWLSSAGSGFQYGTFNQIYGTGTGNKYGSYSYMHPSSNGLQYGVYSEALKPTAYSGFFLGRFSIGTTLTNNYILPASRGTVNQIMQTDGAGNLSWVTPTTIASGTLDQAYDFGGSGVGRIITADAGAVTINGTDGLVSTGTLGSGVLVPSGAGIRMVWNPRKAAFRAGRSYGTEWDDSNLGQASIAFGSGPIASGNSSIAFGTGSVASGIGSTVFGNYSLANAYSSTAMGNATVASGDYSTALGFYNTAPSFGETVLGLGATVYIPSTNGATRFANANATDRLLVVGNAIDVNNNTYFDTNERSDALVILKNGNTGIGNSAPALARLQVQGAVGNTVAMFSGAANSQGVSVVSDWPGIYFNSYYSGGVRSMSGTGFTSIVNTDQSTGGLIFQTNNVVNPAAGSIVGTIPTRMTIMGNGNVGIGTPTPNGLFELGLDQGRKPGTSTWTITSDERLKTIHGNYSKGLEEILKLQPITYNYVNSGNRTFEEKVLQKEFSGFSAQAVQKIFPEAVDFDEDGYLNLNIHSILIASINAIKELDAKNKVMEIQIEEIKTQQEEINSLKAINSEILKRLEKLENK
jgi:hypothetical protein